MATFDLGDVVRLDFTVKVDGVLTAPTTISLTIRDPAGVVTTYTPVLVAVGTYRYDFAPTLAGGHVARWVTTGTGQAAEEQPFSVRAAYSAFSTPEDVAGRWRPLTAPEAVVATYLIEDASGIVRLRAPSVDARILARTLDPKVVAGVVARMVLRVMRNPDGKVSETIDDYSYRRADTTADGLLYLDAEDLSLLAVVGGTGAAFTIRQFGQPGYSTASLNPWGLPA